MRMIARNITAAFFTVSAVGALGAPSQIDAQQPPTTPSERAPDPAKPRVPPTAPTTQAPTTQAPATVPTPDDIVDCLPQKSLPTERLTFFGEQFNAELCLDEGSRNIGMGARTEFPAGTAMVFVHTRPIMLSYWMKNCLIDLDLIFVDGKGRITALHEAKREKLRSKSETKDRYEARLYRYGSQRQAQFAIELPAGTIQRLKPMLGQQVDIDWAKLVKRVH